MGLFSFLSKKNDLPRILAAMGHRVGLGRVNWMGKNSLSYSDEGFSKNVVVFRCVSILAESIANLPLQVKIGEDLFDKHPLLDLINKPNPLQSKSAFIENLVALRLICGKSFLERIVVGGVSKELWVWPDFHFTVHTRDGMFIPEKYVYDHNGVKKVWEVDPISGESDIYNWHSFHPTDPNDGLSPISACAYSVDQHNEAGKWNMRMLQNSAEPSGILNTEKTLTAPQFNKLKKQLEEGYSGADNARRAMLLEGGLTWQQVSLSPKDMDWLGGKNASAQDVAAAYGVPLQVIPLPGSQTFANYAEARLALYEDAVLPLGNDLLGVLNDFVAPAFGDNVKLVVNEDEIAALAPRRAERWTAVTNSQHLTINEKREATGYGKYKATSDPADNIWIAAGLLPLSLDTSQEKDEQDDPTDDLDNPDPKTVVPTSQEDNDEE